MDFAGLPLGGEKSAMAMKNPPHPGDFIRTEIIEAAGLSVTAAAAALGVSRPALSSLLNGKAGLSGDMALRIEKAFGVKMDTLMRMQSAYEIAQTRKREKLVRVQPVRWATWEDWLESQFSTVRPWGPPASTPRANPIFGARILSVQWRQRQICWLSWLPIIENDHRQLWPG